MTQMNLLADNDAEAAIDIPGLCYIPDYISLTEEKLLLGWIDEQGWFADLKRRVQHYGYRYDYKARAVSAESYLGPLPEAFLSLCRRLWTEEIFDTIPDQVIVNEYLPGQGISAHIDCVPCFADTIASLSLGSGCVMEFTDVKTSEKKPLWLEERSLAVLSGRARYEWQHAIPGRKSDIHGSIKKERQRRVSLTFRKVMLDS